MAMTALVLYLVCGGGGAHVDQNTATIQDMNDMSQPGLVVNSRSRSGYSDEVAIEINGESGRIRVPDGLKPRIRGGGSDGWWQLSDIQIGDNDIRARFGLNFMNHPTVLINRITGHVSIHGRSGDFDGDCQPYDPATVQRRF